MAPIWFSIFLEKDNVFLTKREILCLNDKIKQRREVPWSLKKQNRLSRSHGLRRLLESFVSTPLE